MMEGESSGAETTMSVGVHQKGLSSSPSSSAATSAAAPTSLTAAERCWCGKWSRVRAALTAVVVCALTVLFIQQTEYVNHWKPALPLGIGDRAQARTVSPDQLQDAHPNNPKEKVIDDIKYIDSSSFMSTTLFKKKFKSKSKKISTLGEPREISKDDRSERPQPGGGDGSRQAEEASFSSPLIVTEKDWPLKKHLVPIPIKTALALKSSKDTSISRPITLAYIRHCKSQDPHCVENDHMNFRKRCPYPGLEKTEDWDTADIIVFNVWRIRNELYVPNIRRPPGQIWVMFSVEAPSRKQNHSQLDYQGLKGQFNLTMSYRLDSDIPFPYGHLQRKAVIKERDLDTVYAEKRFQAAWLVSHCATGSKREKYVRLLQAAGFEVHIYGSCGNYSCHTGGAKERSNTYAPDSVCLPHLSKNYFFYLSFENTFCKDYMTEKVFKIYDSVDLIPVVMGGADYNKYLPPRTFVNTADFNSARDLARYLVRLSSDKERYLSILREKNKWQRVLRQPWYCTLAERLATGLTPRVQPDVRSWYVRDQCQLPRRTLR